MNRIWAALATVALLVASEGASAQEVRGFAFAGTTTDLNNQHFPALGGGLTVDLGQPWLAAGAQGETFFSWPYFAGRGAVFAAGRILPRSAVRPFVMGGLGFGEDGGPLVGAGVEIGAPRGRLAFRLAIEDYIDRVPTYTLGLIGPSETRHRVATRVGISF